MQKIQVLFPDPDMARLRAAAKRQDRPVSEVIRRAVEEHLNSLPPGDTVPEPVSSFRGGSTKIAPEDFRDAAYSDE